MCPTPRGELSQQHMCMCKGHIASAYHWWSSTASWKYVKAIVMKDVTTIRMMYTMHKMDQMM